MAEYYGTGANETFVGGEEDDFLFGDGGNDVLRGQDGNDALYGWDGSDRLYGGSGADYMRGGRGVDYFDGGAHAGAAPNLMTGLGDRVSFFEGRATHAVIVDLRTGVVTNDGFGNRETLVGIESIGAGTVFADTFYGNDKANFIQGEDRDTIMGFGGNDILAPAAAPALIDGGSGTDLLRVLEGFHWIPDQNGDGSADPSAAATKGVLIDLTAGTFVDGFDISGIVRNVENVEASKWDDVLVGNGLDNTLRGFAGNDRLDGSDGNDVLDGGLGIDTVTYASAAAGVKVNLATTAAQDTGGSGTERLSGIENLVGSGYADSLLGSAVGNMIDGGLGADFMNGGRGNDTYLVDDLGDRVVESESTGGTDTVRSAVSFALTPNIEHLVMTGTAAASGTGNDRSNSLIGNAGANTLKGAGRADLLQGGSGNDKLYAGSGDDCVFGGAGNDVLKGDDRSTDRGTDRFFFDTRPNSSTSHDLIVDFNPADDAIYLAKSIFSRISATGPLAAGAFRSGTAAGDASDRVIYDKSSGNIFYDADGNGSAAAVLFASVAPGTAITSADFVVY